jgi:hypothetical protein
MFQVAGFAFAITGKAQMNANLSKTYCKWEANGSGKKRKRTKKNEQRGGGNCKRKAAHPKRDAGSREPVLFFIQLGGDGTVGSRTELDNVPVNTQRKESLPQAWPPVTGNGSGGARADGASRSVPVLYGD